MTGLDKFIRHKAKLHSQEVDIVRRDLNGTPFDLAITNGRTGVWSERFHEIEPELIEWFTGLGPEHCLWDIGASIGHFSNYAALAQKCQVVAFEPEHQNFSILALNHYLNREALGGRLTPLNVALAPQAGLMPLFIELYGAGEHTKSVTKTLGRYSIPILQLPLDQVLAMDVMRPTHIKIDVDGAEEIVMAAVEPLLTEIQSLFIELPVEQINPMSERLLGFGLKLESTWDVVRMSGGHYDNIKNLIYRRT